MKAESRSCKARLTMAVLIISALLLLQLPTLNDAAAAPGTQAVGGRGNPAPSAPKRRKSSSGGAGSRARARAEQERRRREQAAEEAEEARAEQMKREREQVWMVALVSNRTNRSITYHCSCSGDRTLEPGEGRVYTTRDEAALITFNSGSQEKRYRLKATRVVGHYPTDSDKGEATVNYFELDANGDIKLYAEP